MSADNKGLRDRRECNPGKVAFQLNQTLIFSVHSFIHSLTIPFHESKTSALEKSFVKYPEALKRLIMGVSFPGSLLLVSADTLLEKGSKGESRR